MEGGGDKWGTQEKGGNNVYKDKKAHWDGTLARRKEGQRRDDNGGILSEPPRDIIFRGHRY